MAVKPVWSVCLPYPSPCSSKVWSTDQQHKHHLRAYWKGSVSGLIPGLLNQICILRRFLLNSYAHSVQLLCCAQLCNPMGCSMPDFPVRHQLLELVQIRVHRIDDAIQPSLPLSSPSSAFSLSQHQSLFQ